MESCPVKKLGLSSSAFRYDSRALSTLPRQAQDRPEMGSDVFALKRFGEMKNNNINKKNSSISLR